MGVCCFNPKLHVDNEHENFYRDILYTIRLKRFNFDEVRQRLENSKEKVSKIGDRSEVTFSEKLYNSQTKDFINKDDDYALFHSEIFPKFNALFDLVIPDNPIANFYISVFSLISDSNKPSHVYDIMEEANDPFNLESFLSFLEVYLTENLEGYTGRILNLAQICKNYTVGDFTLSETFYNGMALIAENFRKSKAKEDLIEEIRFSLIAILKKSTSDLTEDNIDQASLDEGMIRRLSSEYPFLWDAIELRNYYYARVYGEDELKHVGN